MLAQFENGGTASAHRYVERFQSPAGGRSLFGPTVESDARYVVSVSTPRSGDRVASTEDAGNTSRLVVRTIAGELVREVDVAPDSRVGSKVFIQDAVLSPSGQRAAWSRFDYEDSDFLEARTALVSGGPQQVLGRDLRPLAFLTEDLLLVNELGLKTLSLSTGAKTAVVRAPDTGTSYCTAFDVTVTHVACIRSSPSGLSAIDVAPVNLAGSTLTIGTSRQLDFGMFPIRGAVFSRDGSRVYYSKPTEGGRRDLFSVPVAGGTPALLGPSTPSDETGVAVGLGESDTEAPHAPHSVGPAVLDGTSATIPYALVPDPTGSGVRFVRTSPGLPTVAKNAVATNPIVDTGLVVGRTYTYAVQAVDRSGNVGEARAFSLVATAPPTLAVPDPTSDSVVGAVGDSSFYVEVAPAANAPETRYSVDQRDAVTNVWTRWLTLLPTSGLLSDVDHDTLPRYAIFGSPAANGQAVTTSTTGRTYVFRGQAIDVHGNATAGVTSQRAVVPFDQTRATYAGSTSTVGRYGAWSPDARSTTAFLRAAGATATIRLAGDRFQVIGEQYPRAGQFDVFLDGVRQARVDTGSVSSSRPRAVLWSKSFNTRRNQVLTVRAVGGPDKGYVVLDAFSARTYAGPGAAGLGSGNQLLRGQQLVSPSGHRAVLQSGDGNLVVYPPVGKPAFATGVSATRVAAGRDGNLVAYDGNKVAFQSRTGGNGASTLIMQNDGNLVLYRDRDGKPTWSSRSGRTY